MLIEEAIEQNQISEVERWLKLGGIRMSNF